jgi:hypothetical protein
VVVTVGLTETNELVAPLMGAAVEGELPTYH